MLKWIKFFRVHSIPWFEYMVDAHVPVHGVCDGFPEPYSNTLFLLFYCFECCFFL